MVRKQLCNMMPLKGLAAMVSLLFIAGALNIQSCKYLSAVYEFWMMFADEGTATHATAAA